MIQLSKNVGHQAAAIAGKANSKGYAVVVTDIDLQDPPKLIVDFVELWHQGFTWTTKKEAAEREGVFKKPLATIL